MSWFAWPISGNRDSNLESPCTIESNARMIMNLEAFWKEVAGAHHSVCGDEL
jgi:hypothetical protein